MTDSEIQNLDTPTLRAIVRSTNPNGSFRHQLEVARAELDQREHGCPIIAATTRNCIAYQNDAADAYAMAMWERDSGALSRVAMLQERARHLHNLAWERLAQLIGAE